MFIEKLKRKLSVLKGVGENEQRKQGNYLR